MEAWFLLHFEDLAGDYELQWFSEFLTCPFQRTRPQNSYILPFAKVPGQITQDFMDGIGRNFHRVCTIAWTTL